MGGSLGYGLWGRLGGLVGRKTQASLRPDQQTSDDILAREKIDKVLAKQDARYDAMSDEERENYYLKPNLMTKIKKAIRGQ
jgi:hypothetical protein